MERSRRSCPARGVAILLTILGLSEGLATAQAPAGSPPSTVEFLVALGRTRDQGVPTVVVATSSTRPNSKVFWRELNGSAWARSQRGLVQFVELPVEENPGLAQQLQVTACPTVLAYASGPGGITCRGARAFERPEEAAGWLQSLGQGDGRSIPAPAPAPAADAGLVRAAYDNGYPSSQQPSAGLPVATPPAAPAQTPASTPLMMLPSAPSMMMPQAPASVIQVPGPNLVVQQGQPNVFVTQAVPSVAYAAPAMAPAAGNMFLPAAPAAMMASPAFAVAPAPSFAVAAPAAALAPAAPAATAATAFAAVTNQSLALPTTGSRTSVRIRGPGFINYNLARLGERLVQRGRSSIETVQETQLGAPLTQSGGGIATISTTSATPMSIPQFAPPAAPQAQPPASPQNAYCPPTPSPQSTPPQKHSLFKHSSH